MRRVLLVVLTAVLAAALARPAAAHTELVSSTPAAGSTATAPAEVVLVFSEAVQPRLNRVSVTGTDGREHAVGSEARGDGATVTQPLSAPLGPGDYTVAYRVLAGDGHPVSGSFEITAVAAAPPPSASGTAAPTSPPSATAPAAATSAPGEVAPEAAETPDDGDGLPVLPLVLGGVVLAGAVGLLARRAGSTPSGE